MLIFILERKMHYLFISSISWPKKIKGDIGYAKILNKRHFKKWYSICSLYHNRVGFSLLVLLDVSKETSGSWSMKRIFPCLPILMDLIKTEKKKLLKEVISLVIQIVGKSKSICISIIDHFNSIMLILSWIYFSIYSYVFNFQIRTS